ncbi:mobilization B domain protein, partial [Bacteroides fragilis str. S13 L11]
MHIDFTPPSNGIYNNAGSCRQLANYLGHEDFERMEKGIYTEGFFNQTEDNIYKSKVIKDIDTNIGQLLKADAK